MSVTLYGIPNCDTVKRSRTWLDAHQITYAFHDYKKFGVDAEKLARWIEQASLGKVLNRAGTTFRKLDEAHKAGLDEAKAIELMVAQPSLIKRPIVEFSGGLLIGFIEAEWAAVFEPE
jgi:Spx/MgsR family transcriptional regulator